jgi:hypothetical protein
MKIRGQRLTVTSMNVTFACFASQTPSSVIDDGAFNEGFYSINHKSILVGIGTMSQHPLIALL